MDRPIRSFCVVASAVLGGCAVSLTKPTSHDFAEISVATRSSGQPAVLIVSIETILGIQGSTVNPDNLPRVTTVYLRAGRYLAMLGCESERQYSVNGQVQHAEDYSADQYNFSVEADKHYVLDCTTGTGKTEYSLKEQ